MKGRAEMPAAGGLAFLMMVSCWAAAGRAQTRERWAGLAPAPLHSEKPNIERLREEWFYSQRAFPRRRIPAGARLRALRQLRRMEQERRENQALENQLFANPPSTTKPAPSATALFSTPTLSTTSWTLIGPQPTNWPSGSYFDFSPTSGRVTELAVDPANASIVYLGSAEGGVWKTTDAGQHWTPLTDQQASLAVGSIAVDPATCTASGCATIYVGTGEGEDFGFDLYYGAGILKSTDGGSSWTRISSPFVGPTGSFSPDCGGASIGALAVDPANSQILLAGVFSTFCASSSGSGIFRSADGGSTWTKVESGDAVNNLMFDSTGTNAYAAMSVPFSFAANGIYKSTNSGQTWTAIDSGLPSATSMGRIALAIAPSTSGSSAVLYAGISNASNSSATLLGVYKSVNGGGAWTQLTGAPDYCGPSGGADQCYFDNVIGVAPNNPNVVALGGSETISTSGYAGTIYLSTDGGSTWSDITNDASGHGVHPDAHALAFSADGSELFAGTDGGVWSTALSSSGAGTWTDLNATLALTQFYPGMSIDPTDPGSAFAGAQDNGTQEYSGQLAWDYIWCGDGAQTAFNYSDLNTLYVGCAYAPPNRNPDGTSADFLYRLTANPPNAAPADSGINGTDRGWFIPPLTMDPSNPNTLYFGTYRVYQTTDGGNSWTAVSSDLTFDISPFLSTVSAIAVAPSDSNTVYVGTNDGMIWESTNAGVTWNNLSANTIRRSVTAIAVDPANAQTAYVTYSGFSGFSDCSGCAIDNQGHVFETTTAGSSWADISGSLPNIPVNAIVVDPDIANTLYIATDIGVFEGTSSGGAWTWILLASGLPKVAVMSLKLQHASRVLRAASYGRSVWDLQLPPPVGPTAVLSTPILFFGLQEVTTTSAAQNVVLTNNSSSALAISGIASANADFTLASGTTCPAAGGTLAAGANCTISVEFTPAAFGARTGTVTITDNAASGTTQKINLRGQATSGAVSLNPASLSFGNQLVGATSAPQTVTLTNTGVAPLTIMMISPPTSNFPVSNDCPLSPNTLAVGAVCHITVTFTPTSTGVFTEAVTIADSAADSPQTITVSGTGIAPAVSLSPASVSFDQEVGTTGTQPVTVTNSGTAPLTVSAVTLAILSAPQGEFSESDNCVSSSPIAPGGTCTISVKFFPTVWYYSGNYGTATADLEISDNAIANQTLININGHDYSGAASLSQAGLNFGNVAVGQTSPPQSVTLTNSGTTTLYVTNIVVPAGFGETDTCPRLTASSPTAGLTSGGNCTIQVTFSPGNPGAASGSMTIWDSTNGGSETVSLSGTGSGASVSFYPPYLGFGGSQYSVDVGTTSQPQTVTVTNNGNSSLNFSSIAITGANASEFAIPTSGTTCSTAAAVAAGANCTVAVTFTPAAAGTATANLAFADNAQGSPQSVSLTGNGIDFGLAVASGSSGTASISPGGSASYSVSVSPTGGFNQAVALTCTGAPSEATCTVSPTSVTLNGQDGQNVKVNVTTTAPSALPPGNPPAGRSGWPVAWWIVMLLLVGLMAFAAMRTKEPRTARTAVRATALGVILLFVALWASCGGGGGGGFHNPGTPAGTYTLAVTGTSGSLTQSTNLTLTVQ